MAVWIAALILTVLGGLLPLVGTAWGGVQAWKRDAQISRWISRVNELHEEDAGRLERSEPLKADEIMRAEGIPFTSWADVSTMRLVVEQSIVRETFRGLRGPAALILVGVLAGSAGAVLALYAV